ncbi:hypothetical protein VQ042_25280 [Aurantimonas sp. A2-1-M11]
MIRKQYVVVIAAGIVVFIFLGIGSFYLGEWLNAPTGVIEDNYEEPDVSE